MPADRLYYHLAQLEKASLIRIAEYRPLPAGKVERVYGPTDIEPPGDAASYIEVSNFLNAVLEATQLDITAASLAKEEGKRRNIHLQRTAVRLSEAELTRLGEQISELISQAQERSKDEGVWTRILVTWVDLQNRDESEEREGKGL